MSSETTTRSDTTPQAGTAQVCPSDRRPFPHQRPVWKNFPQAALDLGLRRWRCPHCERTREVIRAGSKALWGSHDGPCGRMCAGSHPDALAAVKPGDTHSLGCAACAAAARGSSMPMWVRFVADGGAEGFLDASTAAEAIRGFPADLFGEQDEEGVYPSGVVAGGFWYRLGSGDGYLGEISRVGERRLVWCGRTRDGVRLWETVEWLGQAPVGEEERASPPPSAVPTSPPSPAPDAAELDAVSLGMVGLLRELRALRAKCAEQDEELAEWRRRHPRMHTGMGDQYWPGWPTEPGLWWAYCRPTSVTHARLELVSVESVDGRLEVVMKYGRIREDQASSFSRRFIQAHRLALGEISFPAPVASP